MFKFVPFISLLALLAVAGFVAGQGCHADDFCIDSDQTVTDANLLIFDGNVTITADYVVEDSNILIRQLEGEGPAILRVDAGGTLTLRGSKISTVGDVHFDLRGDASFTDSLLGNVAHLQLDGVLTQTNVVWTKIHSANIANLWDASHLTATIDDGMVSGSVDWADAVARGNLTVTGDAEIQGALNGTVHCTGSLAIQGTWNQTGGLFQGCSLEASGVHEGAIALQGGTFDATSWQTQHTDCEQTTVRSVTSKISKVTMVQCDWSSDSDIFEGLLEGNGTIQALNTTFGAIDFQGDLDLEGASATSLKLSNGAGLFVKSNVVGAVVLDQAAVTAVDFSFGSWVASESTFVVHGTLAPVVAYANEVAVSGAEVTIRNGTSVVYQANTEAGVVDGHSTKMLHVTPTSVYQLTGWTATVEKGTYSKVHTFQLQNPRPLISIVDQTAPTAIANLTVIDGLLTWNGGTDESGDVEYTIALEVARPAGSSSGQFTVQSREFALPLTVQGTYTVTVTPVDHSGNQGGNETIQYVHDETAPVILATPPSSGWHGAVVRWNPLAEDLETSIVSTKAFADGKALQVDNGTVIVDSSGIFNVVVQVEDKGGNIASTEWTIRIDLTPPTVTKWVADRVALSAVDQVSLSIGQFGQDELSGIAHYALEINSSNEWTLHNRWLVLPDAIQFRPEEGTTLLRWRTVDNAGQSSVGPVLTIHKDSIAPAIAGGVPSELVAGSWQLQIDDASALQSVSIWQNGELIHSGNGTLIPIDLAAGEHQIRVKAVDASGNLYDEEFTVRVVESGKDTPGLFAPLIPVILGIFARNRNNAFNPRGV